jgi:predicted ATPase
MSIEIPQIVLTGGPCAGKTRVLSQLSQDFGEVVEMVPEAANMLIGGGFPMPSDTLPYSERWQLSLQDPLYALQYSIEANHQEIARNTAKRLVVCDRGVLDQAAFFKRGVDEFLDRFRIPDISQIHERYKVVIHLGTVAFLGDKEYREASSGSQIRVESEITQVLEVEQATREAWQSHPNRVIVEPSQNFEEKYEEVAKIVKDRLKQGGTK